MNSAWNAFQSDFNGKRVAVFGLGRQGGGIKTTNTLVRAEANVTVFDALSETDLADEIRQLDMAVTLRCSNNEPDLTSFEYVVKNPAIPFSHPSVEAALSAGIPVVGETALTLQYVRDRSVGITGTRGKTTTTTLTGRLLKAAGKRVLVGGNIPQSPALSLLPEFDDECWMVLEISSFQLESLGALQVSPHIALVTNIYPDHLNRYNSLEEYAGIKAEIFRYLQEGDVALVGGPEQWHSLLSAAVPPEAHLEIVSPAERTLLQGKYHTELPGDHNWDNIAAVEHVRAALDLPESALQLALDGFTGVPYRLETVRKVEGIRFINDTTSTTPVALEKALDAFPAGSFVLIAGGTTKHLPFEETLLQKLSARPAAIFLLPGSGSTELEARMNHTSEQEPMLIPVKNLQTAVEQSFESARMLGLKTVVFSPGFSSFELFKNEFDRGDRFNDIVRGL